MGENRNDTDIEKYLKDIHTIKNTLIKIEERPLFETWLFFASSFLSFLLAFLHYIASAYFQLPIYDIFLKIWLPITVIGYSLEPLALIKRMSKEAIPLFSRNIIKLYLGMAGVSIASLVIVLLIIKADALDILPATLLLLFSMYYFLYAQVAYSSWFFYGFFTIFVCIMFSVLNIAVETQFILVPVVLGLSALIMGITELKKEKNDE